MITWLEDPLKYSYLRKMEYMTGSSKFPVKSIGKNRPSFNRLIGYERISKHLMHARYCYFYNVYYLRDHDRDISPEGVYAGEKGFVGKMPSEAVNPIALIEGDINERLHKRRT